MTADELKALKGIRLTFEEAYSQKEIFWAKEIMASGLTSLDALINRSEKALATPINNQSN
jgi:hypothetical protein